MRPFPHRHPSILAVAMLAASFGVWPQDDCRGQNWVDQKVSGPFYCRAEFPLNRMDPLLRELAQLQNDLVRCLGVPPAQEPIELYIFRDKWTYTDYLKQHLPTVPFRRALYVKSQGPGRVLTYWSDEIGTDVRHECTHALLHAVLPVVPLWLDEGLAEYFEVPAEKRSFDNPHLESLRWALRLGTISSMDSLERKATLQEMGKNEYRDAWAWVHFMLHGPQEAHAELGRYLQDLQASVPPGFLSQRVEQRVSGTPQRFTAHFHAWKR